MERGQWLEKSKLPRIILLACCVIAAVYFLLSLVGQIQVSISSDESSEIQHKILYKTGSEEFFPKAKLTANAARGKCKKHLPQAIIAGHLKSGTGALVEFLNEHPQISSCNIRTDVQFFNKFYVSRGIKWYQSIMPCTFKNQITIEKTAQYFSCPTVAERIRKINPTTKIIIILKDLVKVAVSLYAMWREHKSNHAHEYTFERMISKTNGTTFEIDPNSKIIKLCSYVQHMKQWLQVFNRTQVLILDGNSFDDHPARTLKGVEKFLNVKHFFDTDHFVFNATKGKYCFRRWNGNVRCLPEGKGRPHPKLNAIVIQILTDYYKPMKKMLFKVINQTLW